MRSAQPRVEPPESEQVVSGGGRVQRCADLSHLSDVDRCQALLSQTARFAALYLRWLDANSGDGLTFHRLMVIRSLHCGGPAMMSELASVLGVSPRNMTAIIDGLEREHLVARRAHPTDRRATLVELTSDGGATVDTSLDPGIEALGKLFGGLDAEEQQRFLVTIDRLIGAMESSAPRTNRGPDHLLDRHADQPPQLTGPQAASYPVPFGARSNS